MWKCEGPSLVLLSCAFSSSFMCLDSESVLFVRRFWTSIFEQVVFALGLLSEPSERDVSPVVKRHFRLFD